MSPKKLITAIESDLRLQVGAKVAILQHKHLKCATHGFVQFIDGAYISVRPEDVQPVESDACERTLELYSNELTVVEVYTSEQFKIGTIVRIQLIDWNGNKPKTHGIVIGVEAERVLVQPIGADKGAIISVLPGALQIEGNEDHQTAESVATQTAIMALLAAFGGSAPITQLKTLLATLLGYAEVETHLALLANAGKIRLTEAQASFTKPDCLTLPTATATELQQSIAALVLAEERLVEAVRQVVLQAQLTV